MRLVFCCDPTNPRAPERAFQRELEAARRLGIDSNLFDLAALPAGGAADVAPRPNALAADDLAVHRGLMMRSARNQQLYDPLLGRGRRLINSPERYQHCHHLPEPYSVMAKHTPGTVWLEGTWLPDMDKFMRRLARFGGRPLVVKDCVRIGPIIQDVGTNPGFCYSRRDSSSNSPDEPPNPSVKPDA